MSASPSLPPTDRAGFLGMPLLPVAGFLVRLLAFVVDLILLIAAIHLFARHFEPVLWALDRWTPYLTGGLAFFYFSFFNGPFGRGQTIGKMILGIAVTDYDGAPPTLRQAMRRTLILIPIFVTAPVGTVLFSAHPTLLTDYVRQAMSSYLFLSVLIATAICVPFNPFKQGLHDFLGRTLVRPKKALKDAPTFEDLAAQVGAGWLKFHRQPQYSGLVTVAMMMALFLVMSYPGGMPKPYREYLASLYGLARIPGFAKARLEPEPLSLPVYEALTAASDEKFREALAAEDTPSSAPLTLILEVKSLGAWPMDVDSSETLELGRRYLRQYHATSFPLLLDHFAGMESPRYRGRSSAWRERPVTLRLHFISILPLTPHVRVLFRKEGEVSESFPPLGPKSEE